MCDKAYTEEEFTSIESRMLIFFSSVDFPFSTPTALSTLEWLVRRLSFPPGSKAELFANYLVDLTLQAQPQSGVFASRFSAGGTFT